MNKYKFYYTTRNHKNAQINRPNYDHMIKYCSCTHEEILASYEEVPWKEVTCFEIISNLGGLCGIANVADWLLGEVLNEDPTASYTLEWENLDHVYHHISILETILEPRDLLPFWKSSNNMHMIQDDSCDTTLKTIILEQSELKMIDLSVEERCHHSFKKTSEIPISHEGKLVAEHKCDHCGSVEYREVKVVLR